MNSRDLSSASSMTVTRDGGSAADDDGVFSANASLVLFQSGKYAECVDVLMQILRKKEGDPKVVHNIALAKFFRDGCSEPKKFLEALLSIKKKCGDLAHASREQLLTVSASGNKTVSRPKPNSASRNSCVNTGVSNNVDASLATLNMAIVLYHLHDYSKALSLLEPLFQNIEPLDEGTALHVCLLLLDLAVCTQDAVKFADVISYIGKAFGNGYTNPADNGCIGAHQPSNMASKSSSVPSSAASSDYFNSDYAANASEDTLSRTFSDEGIDYDNLFTSMDIAIGGVKYQTHHCLPALNDLSQTFSDRSFVDSKLKAPLYKVQLLLLIRNLKVAKRELKLAMNIACGRDSSIALLLKAQLELCRGNYTEAEKLLKASHSQQESGNTIMFDNNMGCIFFQWGKFYASGVFFCKALLGCSSLRKENPQNLSAFFRDKTFLIVYNSGLQYLACGKPDLAAQCLQKASLVFYNRPLLWIRLAECCLMALEKGMAKSFEVAVIGQGKWRHLGVISGSAANGQPLNSGEKVKPGNDKGAPKLSMSFARQCLWKALELVRRFERKPVKCRSSVKLALDEYVSSEGLALSKRNYNPNSVDSMHGSVDNAVNENGDTKEHKGGGPIVSLAVYENVCRREYLTMKQAILADLAFVELELGNPVVALAWSSLLLQIPECSKIYTFLARVYAAECLCLLNRLAEAAEQLSVYISGGIANVQLPYRKEDYEQWYAQWLVSKPLHPKESNLGSLSSELSEKDNFEERQEGAIWKQDVRQPLWQDSVLQKPEEAQGALYVNLAAMCAMQGQLDLAWRYSVKALWLIPNSREANLMVVYLDIKQGRIGAARSRLRRCTRVRFVSCGDWSSRGSS